MSLLRKLMTWSGVAGSGAAAAVLWTPDGTSGASLWLDTLTPASLTLSGAVVTSIADLSGNGRTFTGVGSPTYSATAVGSLPGIIFDGSTQWLRRDTAWQYAAGSSTVYMVLTSSTPALNDTFISEGRVGQNTQVYAPIRASSATASSCISLITRDAGGNDLASTPTTTGVFTSATGIIARIDSGTNMSSRFNGTLGTNADYTRSATTLDVTTIMAKAQGVPNASAQGVLHEIFIVSGRVPTQAESERFEGYFTHRWGIAAVLPALHPYKSAAPLA